MSQSKFKHSDSDCILDTQPGDGKWILIWYQRDQDKAISNDHGGITGTVSCAFDSVTVTLSEIAGTMGDAFNSGNDVDSALLTDHIGLIHGEVASLNKIALPS